MKTFLQFKLKAKVFVLKELRYFLVSYTNNCLIGKEEFFLMGLDHKTAVIFTSKIGRAIFKRTKCRNGVTMWDSKLGRALQYICPIKYKRVNIQMNL